MTRRPEGRSAALTERGRRRVNQDAVLVERLNGSATLVAVADGMGGHAAGEVASQRALDTLREAVDGGAGLEDAVATANRAVWEVARELPDRKGMGTTLVALLERGAAYTIANVGDSRAYRIDARGVHRLTRDHSFIADAVFTGELSTEEAERSPWRNAVTRAIGSDPTVEVDCFGPFDSREPHVVLLCSDGVHRFLEDAELHRTLEAVPEPERAARELIDAALLAGSDDNLSVALLRFDAAEAPQPADRRPPLPRRGRAADWTWVEGGVILLGVVLVMIYIVFLLAAA
jgi:PPM family protein phosphatase